MNLTKSGEVAEFHDISQFRSGESTQMCGYYSVALCAQCVPPGQALTLTEEQVHDIARSDYEKYAGPDVASNKNGMTTEELYACLNIHQLAYNPLIPNTTVISNWLVQGYPVIIALAESSVYDMELGKNPYPWNTSGYNHIVTATGVKNGNLLIRDTANIAPPNSIRPGPRVYAVTRLRLISATLVKPRWKVVPPPAALPHIAINTTKVFPMINPTNDDKTLWSAVKSSVPFDPSHGIPQAWLQALYNGVFLGCPVENERGGVIRDGKTITEQCFTASVARWYDGACFFYGPTGLLFKY